MEPHPYLPPPSLPSLGDGEACGLSSHCLHLQPRGTSLSRAEGGHTQSHCRAGGRHKTSSLSCRKPRTHPEPAGSSSGRGLGLVKKQGSNRAKFQPRVNKTPVHPWRLSYLCFRKARVTTPNHESEGTRPGPGGVPCGSGIPIRATGLGSSMVHTNAQ